MEYPIPLLKTVVMAATLVVMYVVMFRPSKTHTATMWSDGLYCHHLDAWYYAAWMVDNITVRHVVVRKHNLLSKRQVMVFEKTDDGLIFLGIARRTVRKYYLYTGRCHA